MGSPSLAAAPVGPEIWPWLSASAASIISFSCLSSAPLSAGLGLAAWGGSRLIQVSSTERVSPSLRMTARSITFCSSRTLPGQPYAWNSWRVFRLMVLNFFPAFFPKRSIKYSTSKGMSAARSRNAGISIGTTFSLYRRSCRNLPSATSAFKSRWVAASPLTSMEMGLLLPTR